MKFTVDNYEYIFIPNTDGVLVAVQVSIKVDPKKFVSTFTPSPAPGAPATINIGGDKTVYDDLVNRVQTIESALGLLRGVKRISWLDPKTSLHPETEEEKRDAKVISTQWKREYPDPLIDVRKILGGVIQSIDDYEAIKVPLSFWREGVLDYNSHQYINAFFNFYFVIEGFFGNGNTHNDVVEKALIASKEFNEHAALILQDLEKDLEKKQKLETWLTVHHKQLNVTGIAYFLVNMRGELHHFNSRRPRGTPFTHQEYHYAAWIAMVIALHAILGFEIKINVKRALA